MKYHANGLSLIPSLLAGRVLSGFFLSSHFMLDTPSYDVEWFECISTLAIVESFCIFLFTRL